MVEGRYDKNTLSQVVDAVIVETGGFAVFRDRERLELIRAMAKRRGIIVFTDPDGAGFRHPQFPARSRAAEQVKHAYVPDIKGKEKRKSSPSKEGKLGLEGHGARGHTRGAAPLRRDHGRGERRKERRHNQRRFLRRRAHRPENSAGRRKVLLRRLGLPERMTPKAMLQAVNVLMDREEFLSMAAALDEHDAESGD